MAGFTDRIAVIIDATSSGAVQELDKLQREAKKTDTAFDTLGKKFGVAGSTIKAGLAAGAAALVGTGLVSFLNDSVEAFGDGAKAAGELATATGGTVDEVSRLQAALKGAGIEADASAGLLTKFTTQAGKQSDLLDELGVSLKTGADGSADYADAMVQAVDAIVKIGDASKRNQALVDLFGKKGAQAFQELADSGISLSESMRLVNQYQVFTAEDVARAKAYDDAMDTLDASVQGLQFTLGRLLIPVIAAGAEAFTSLLDAAMAIPGPVYVAVGAFAALNVVMKAQLTGTLLSAGATLWTGLAGAYAQAGGAAALAAGGIRGLSAALAANPLGLVILGITTAVLAFNAAGDRAKKVARGYSDELIGLMESGVSAADAVKRTAEQVEEASSLLDDLAASGRGQGWLWAAPPVAVFKTFLDAVRGGGQDLATYRAELEKIAEEYGTFAAAQADASAATQDLNDLIADGITQGPEFEDAARRAAEAQAEVDENTRLAEEAMARYNQTIGDVLESLGKLDPYGSDIEDLANQLQGILDMDTSDSALQKLADDAATWGDETKIGAADARDAIIGFLQDADISNAAEALDLLKDIKAAVPAAGPVVDALIAEINAATSGNPPETVDVPWKPAPVPGTVEEAETRKAALAEPVNTVITIDSEFAPDGYNAVKARKDYLAQAVSTDLVINTVFSPDGYNAVKARKDYLSQDRTATITVDVAGLSAARAQIDALQPAASGQQIVLPQANFSPINLVRVSIDGQQLRAIVRDEVGRVQPEPAGVA